MNLVRKSLLWLTLLGSFSFAYFGRVPNVCDKPIQYKIEVFDERFKLSKNDFLNSIKEAESYWEKVAGRKLFEYNPSASLAINLVYDDRQATTQNNQVLEAEVDKNKESANSIKSDLESLESKYKTDLENYNTAVKNFKYEESKYVAEVDYYNSRGGAPKSDFDKLTQEKQNLDERYKELEAERLALNDFSKEINVLVDKHNVYVKNANQNINTLNAQAGKEFNEGEYISDQSGERINVYEFTSKTKLVRLVEHELGHALGLEHDQGLDSIMYYLNQSENLIPTKEDKALLDQVCQVKKSYLQSAIDVIKSIRNK